jgi:hypothetical protein
MFLFFINLIDDIGGYFSAHSRSDGPRSSFPDFRVEICPPSQSEVEKAVELERLSMSFVSSQCIDSLHTVSCCEFEGTFVARMGIPYFLSQINWGLFAGCPFKVTLTTSGFCGIQVGTAN